MMLVTARLKFQINTSNVLVVRTDWKTVESNLVERWVGVELQHFNIVEIQIGTGACRLQISDLLNRVLLPVGEVICPWSHPNISVWVVRTDLKMHKQECAMEIQSARCFQQYMQ
jgi:ABC-type taurine transport system substrate-binding protein